MSGNQPSWEKLQRAARASAVRLVYFDEAGLPTWTKETIADEVRSLLGAYGTKFQIDCA